MWHTLQSLAVLSLLPFSLAAHAPAAASIQKRQLLDGNLNNLGGLVGGVLDTVNKAVAAGDPNAVLSALGNIAPLTRPTDIPDVKAKQSAIWASPTTRTDFYAAVATQVARGLAPDNLINRVLGAEVPTGEDSTTNNNPAPQTPIYPKKSESDAPFTLSETLLRQAIYIPSGFTYGIKPPVLFIPGTGSYGGSNFAANLRKLLTGKPFADPVWLNIPGALLGDAQINAEYIAYAINYIAAISQKTDKINVISWSQGGLGTQWALKYWPSTRLVLKDFLPISADFRGTVLANVLCLSVSSDIQLNPLCPPSVIQQDATSHFVAALQRDGGNSAYVPTTTIYSGLFDEVVEPQQGSVASAYLRDTRGVGVANIEVQNICAGLPGGSFYGHAGLLFCPLTYALIVDALTHDGPGDVSRIDVQKVCSTWATEGLDLVDVIATTGLIPVSAVAILTYPDRRASEPSLNAYAM